MIKVNSLDTSSMPGVYTYKYFPQLAKQILDEHLMEFCTQQLTYARQYNVPLLKFLHHFTEKELLEISAKSNAELLLYIIENKAYEQIKNATSKWMSNQLDVVGKYDIVAEDITLINHARGKAFKNFAYSHYRDESTRIELLHEIDDFLLGSTTASANTYIGILKDQIQQEVVYNARLSDALPGFIYVYDVQKNEQVHSNGKLNEMLGYDIPELQELSKHFYKSIIHTDDYEKAIKCRQDFFKDKASICSFECRLRDKEGNYKWLRFYETNLKTQADGVTVEIIGTAFDISHEREITTALALREKQLLEAQSIAHIGSYEWDIQGLKTTISTPEIHRIFEMEKLEKFEEFMNHVHKDDVQLVHDAIAESFETGLYQCVYRYLRNNREKFIWSQGVVTKVNGIPTTMVGTVQDITLIKKMEEALREKATQLEKSNERLQEFAAIASHDLKEPLRKISIFSSKVILAESDKISESSNVTLQKIQDNAIRMQKMVEDILEFSFISGAQGKECVSLENLIKDVKDLLSETIRDKDALILTDRLPDAFVNPSQMKQVFQNLISNALKFSKAEERPVIEISHSFIAEHPTVLVERRKLIIQIKDNGIGFKETDSQKIFGLFSRLHTQAAFEGSGLGLSICQKIMESHGGSISASSVAGKGSVFTLEFPFGEG